MRTRLSLCLALLLTACRPAGAPLFVAEQREVQYKAKLSDRPAVSPDDVRVFLRDELPEGFERDTTSRALSSAPEFPSSDDPNVILGALSLTEKFDASTDELRGNSKALDTPERLAALKVEAARHGANAVIASGGHYEQAPWSTSRYEGSYEAVYLSTKPRAYPTVDELLKRLSLPDGFREIQRVSLDLADLRTATLDVPLRRGNCYLLALAFAPGEVSRPQRGPDEVTPIDFKMALQKPIDIPGRHVIDAGDGSFTITTNSKDGKSWHRLDGIWSRAGAGGLGCPIVDDQKGKVSFHTMFGAATAHPPPFNPGKGAAQLMVFEKTMPKAELDERLCGMCFDTSKECSLRKPLASCAPLQSCLATVHMSLPTCEPFLDK